MVANDRLSCISRHYDSERTAIRYYEQENRKTLRQVVSEKQLSIVASDLNSMSFESDPLGLDIGCSSGKYLKKMKIKGFASIGIDTAIIPLKYAKKRVDAELVQASATNLPFKRNMFDVVICIELLHHFTDEILENVLEDISYIIKPGGLFIFDLKNRNNPFLAHVYKEKDSTQFTLKARSMNEIRRSVTRYGFKIIKTKSIMFPILSLAPYIIIFGKKVN
jgi:2-polyprenyl-3-methyl-5-hydroxy-6-metoxy-1,4-benzoquinol methylase